MKTMFESGLRPDTMFFGSPVGSALGQVKLRGALGQLGQAEGVTQALRDGTLKEIGEAQQKYDAVHRWIASYFDSDPMLEKLLGPYKDNFWSYSDLAESRQGEADYVYQNFGTDNPGDWNAVTQKDLDYVQDWKLSIDQMYEAIKLVDPTYLSNPVGKKPMPIKMGPTTQATGPIQGPGARQVPGVPAAKPGTLATPAPGSTILGIPQKDALIGAGLAVGVGVLIYAILG